MNLFYKIGEFAKLCNVTVKTLRHYEQLGLLVPAQVDDWTGYRYYHVGQLQQMESIRSLKSVGFSLEEIGDLLQSDSQVPTHAFLMEKLRQTDAQLLELNRRRQQLQSMADSRKHYQNMENISLQSLPSITVACHRATIPSYDALGELCVNVIGPEMARIGCQCPEPGYCFTWEPSHEYRDHDIDIEYCEQVSQALPDTDLIKFRTLEAVPQALCMKAYGPYAQLHQHYLDLFELIEKKHYRVVGAPRACYVDGPWNQTDPAKWLTIIQVPVQTFPVERPTPNRLHIFACPSCGNVAFAYGKTSMECCGNRLEPLPILQPEDDQQFKASEFDGEYLLEYDNPMTKDDYIAAVVVERLDSVSLHRLFPEQQALVHIPSLRGSKIYTIFRHHGTLICTLQK